MAHVDPIKTFEAALEGLTNQIAALNLHVGKVESYAKISREKMEETKAAVQAMVAVTNEFKHKQGLMPDKAVEHLKAIAAVLKYAEEGGVSLTEDLVEVATEATASAKAWAGFLKLMTDEEEAECNSCGSYFDLYVTGWQNDQGYPYCNISCLIEANHDSYYPSVPYIAGPKAPKDNDWFPMHSAVHTKTGTSLHVGCYASVIKKRKANCGLDHTEGWLDFSRNTGTYRPDWRRTTSPSSLFQCNNCATPFNLYEGGWKAGDRFFCCNHCAVVWDGEGKLTCPGLPEVGVSTDSYGYVYSYNLEDSGYVSWVDLAVDNGYVYPKGVWS